MTDRSLRRCLALAALVLPLVAGCFGAPVIPSPTRAEGAHLAIDVAALNLAGVGDVVWDLEVRGGAGAVVWQRRLTSSAYGDSVGSASYVGPCDADPEASDNTVRVWVVGVYDGDIATADAGSFNAGATTGPGAVTGTALPFQNPTTTAAPLFRGVTCLPDADVAVRFDVTLMRPAQQGFFDIAVSFNDLFCSAKFDCCQDADNNGCAAGGAEDIKLLFDASGARARTFVLGFACTAGTGAGVATELYLDDLVLDCDGVAPAITVHPAGAAPGNQCTAGPNGMSLCPAVTAHGAVDADDYLFQIATFRGEERLTSGGLDANKVYWNVALGVKAAISGCRLTTRGTADDANDTDDSLVAGVIAPGAVYPLVAWDVDLGTCASEPLTFGASGASVATGYSQTGAATAAFAYRFAPGLAPGAVCAPACLNGGTCSAPGICACAAGFWGPLCAASCAPGQCAGTMTCDAATGAALSCTSCAAGYTGATCQTPVCAPACQNGGTCTAPDTCDCTATGYTGATCQTPVCDPACQNGGACTAPDTCDCTATGYSGTACETPAVPPSTRVIASADLFHQVQNFGAPAPYVPFSVAGTVTLNNTADGYVFALGSYFNTNNGAGALYQAGVVVANGKLQFMTVYYVPGSVQPFNASAFIANITPGASFHLAVEVTSSTQLRVAINGTWVANFTTTATPPGYPGVTMLGNGYGLGTPNEVFYGLAGTVTNYRYWNNQLIWNGANFNPALY